MDTKFLEVVCDEHGIGGGGEYCGDNDEQLGRTDVLYHEASGGKYVPRAVFFDLQSGEIEAATRRALPPGKPREPKRGRGQKTASSATTQGLGTNSELGKNPAEVPCSVTAFVVNSEPHAGARPSFRVCGGPELARCILNVRKQAHKNQSADSRAIKSYGTFRNAIRIFRVAWSILAPN
jgi:hypothetical protein